ncbi:OmpA family protein [Lentisalinibacter orientalis]|uniref:OmpA family protein n=1 Tax=Lentisalinibacter orientalis TaxID=2992241 RepID=UPI00386C54EB
MSRTIAVFTATFIALFGTAQALAGDNVGEVYITPSIVYMDDDAARNVDDGVIGGQLAIGYALNRFFNIEGFINVGQLDGAQDFDQYEVGANLLGVFNREGIFSPYLLAGISQTDTDEPLGGSNNEAASSIGAGFMLDLGNTPATLRAEWRYRTELAGYEFEDQIATLGIQFPLAGGKPRVVDTDGDGVPDDADRCPGTPIGTPVDRFGCELDSDGDGVVDSVDECPNTTPGAAVDARGCERDSDGDGVVDSRDQCPGTPAGAPVDEVGCELDSDGDGVVDRLDECPNTAAGVPVDTRGCEIKDVIRLQGVQFELNSDRLRPGAENVLDDAAETLKRNPGLEVEVAGHTDSQGAAAYNQGLSERRARTVMDYLIGRGVDEDMLSYRGYGESQPIADNATAAGRAENRRVELRILDR